MANNGEKSSELTARQRRMIAAMLTNKNIGEACEAAKVGRSTLARWLDQEPFINALIILAERARNEGVKRAAANDLLAYSLKFHDQAEIEDRIAALEKAVLNGK